MDDEINLYYYGARYMDPTLGRFITSDILVQSPSDPQTLNRYSYTRNNPIIFTDPTGHLFGIDDLIIGAVIGSLTGGITAAVTDGDIGMGFLTGAISGAIFGGVGGLKLDGIAQSVANSIGGAASGGINAIITGGDPIKGALIGGISAGVADGLEGKVNFLKPVKDQGIKSFSSNFVRRSIVGGVVGGTTASTLGDDFIDGFQHGAFTASIAFTSNHWLHDQGLPWLKEQWQNITSNFNQKKTNFHRYLIEVGAEMEKGYMTNMQNSVGSAGVYAGAYASIGNIPKGIGYSNKHFIEGGRIAYRWANQYGNGVKSYSAAQVGFTGAALSVTSAAMTAWTLGETINAYYWGYVNYKAKY